jgi:hypothetical protein
MDDGVWRRAKKTVQQLLVAYVAPHKTILGRRVDRGEILQVPGVSQLIEVDDEATRVAPEEVADEI